MNAMEVNMFIKGRTIGELKDKVLEILNAELSLIIDSIEEVGEDMAEMNGSLEDRATCESLIDDITTDTMYDDSDAKWLEVVLTRYMNIELEEVKRPMGEFGILDIDAIAIYPDMWGLYCAPHRYRRLGIMD